MPDDPEGPDHPDEDQLLPGEPTSFSSGNSEDVRHWIEVYRELVDAKRRMLAEITEERQEVQPPGKAELDKDRRLIQRETDRLARRLDYWEQVLRRRDRG